MKEQEQKVQQEKASGILQQESQTLYEMLAAYGRSDFYPCHMPGHKRSSKAGALSDFFRIDITEIDGFDNLHQAEGILDEAQKRAAALYGSEETFFLVNGSTCGVLAAILSVTDLGDTILVARNCHKSVYHGAFLQGLHLRYLYPKYITEYDIHDAIGPQDVEEALEKWPECRAVVITSPTYEGMISDIREISRIVHKRGKILIVDSAHGAHLGLVEGVPENAVTQGADLVIHSLHKTLPSMTQTALLHVNGTLADRIKVRRYLRILQSSSPSYVLMASIDSCVAYVAENAAACFEKLKRHYWAFMERMEHCNHIRIGTKEMIWNKGYHFIGWDICKLVISVKGTSMSGQALYDCLREEFHLQMEMAAGSYVLAIMTIMDEEEGWQRLADALLQIDGRIEDKIEESRIEKETMRQTDTCQMLQDNAPAARMSIAQAYQSKQKKMQLSSAQNKIIGDFINLYPPGIPILVPGEVIGEREIRQIQDSIRMGLQVQGVTEDERISVIDNSAV